MVSIRGRFLWWGSAARFRGLRIFRISRCGNYSSRQIRPGVGAPELERFTWKTATGRLSVKPGLSRRPALPRNFSTSRTFLDNRTPNGVGLISRDDAEKLTGLRKQQICPLEPSPRYYVLNRQWSAQFAPNGRGVFPFGRARNANQRQRIPQRGAALGRRRKSAEIYVRSARPAEARAFALLDHSMKSSRDE